MSTTFEDVKQSIVEAQLAATPKDKLVNDMIKGTAELLSADDIIKRLGIRADEFEKLVDLPNHYLRTQGGLGAALHTSKHLFDVHIELINKELESKTDFPKPDLYILGKARWKRETFKKWLEAQCV